MNRTLNESIEHAASYLSCEVAEDRAPLHWNTPLSVGYSAVERRMLGRCQTT